MTNNRVVGFDLARAYAIFGMYIVNFNFCFGSFQEPTPLGHFLTAFVGNSTSIFIVLAGMGLTFLSQRAFSGGEEERKRMKNTVLKRSWFLFAWGLLLYNWWPGDILHFYGGYMHLAALVLFVPKRYYLWIAVVVILGFHALLPIIPVTTGWVAVTSEYTDFWTVQGFLRNTFYNGWNSIFPWLSFFMAGMWLGHLDWQDKKQWRRVFLTGLLLFSVVKATRILFKADFNNPQRHWFYNKYWDYVCADYFPPYLPFLLITLGFALMVIPICMSIAARFPESLPIRALAATGQMTLSHYIIHLTLGMLIFSGISGKPYSGLMTGEAKVSSTYILLYACMFFIGSVFFSVYWGRTFKKGPFELLMRRFSKT